MSERVQTASKKPEAKRENKVSQTQKTGPSQSISSPVEQILFLQRTIGNQAVRRLIKSGVLHAKLMIGQPGDIYEQEADRVAERVMRIPDSQVSNETKVSNPVRNIQRRCPGCNKGTKKEEEEELGKNITPGVQRMVEQESKAEGASAQRINPDFQRAIQLPNGGLPLSDTVRLRIEPVLGEDLGNVRVHSDSNSNEAAKSLQAKAFTHQNHIWLASGQSSEDITLMAHEATHVVQQTGRESGRMSVRCSPGDNQGGFWSSVGEGIVSGGRTLLSYGQAGVTAVGEGIGSAVEAGGEVVSGAVGMTRDAIIGFLEERAPGALAFFRGLRNFVSNGVTAGFDSIFSGVAESYQEGGIGGALEYIFVDLAGGALRGIGGFIAGSCSALGETADWLIDVGTQLGGEAIAAVTAGASAVANFLNGIWERYGAPAEEAIRGFIGGIWDSITETVSEWWDLLEPIRTVSREVWDWLVSTILGGIQSLNDLITRVFAWAVEKWDEIKKQILPFMGYVKAVAAILLLLSPMGPFVAAGAAVYGLYKLIQYLWQMWGKSEIRQRLVTEVLPQIIMGIAVVEQKIDVAKGWLTGLANGLVNLGMELLNAIRVLPVLRMAQGVISSIYAEFQLFDERVRETLEHFADLVHQLMQSAYQFLQPILEFMRQLVLVVLFGPLAIIDDGVWKSVKRIANLAMTVPCIRELAGLGQLQMILEYAARFRNMMISAWQIIKNPEPIWQALHDAIAPMVEAVPGIAASIIARSIYPTEEQHRRGVEAHLIPAIEHLQNNWWEELKKMGWTLLWPWDEVAKSFPQLLEHGWNAIKAIFNLEIGQAVDELLLMQQNVNMVLGAVWGWFALAAVLIGGVLGALGVEFTAGASIGAGVGAGWALASEVGLVLLAMTAGTEMAIIGKAMFDIRFTNEVIKDNKERNAANDSDYTNIANSTFTLAVLTALVVLGALAGKLASSIWSKVRGHLPRFRSLEEFLNRPRGTTRSAGRMETGARAGVDPTPESIRVGDVRMEQHPNFRAAISEIEARGFEIRYASGDPHVMVREVINPAGEVLRVERLVYLREGMRYLDLEHEIGHINQLTERFGGNVRPTERWMEYPDGRLKQIENPPGTEVLTKWQDTITEYHNRLQEYLRLQERGAGPDILREHAKGIAEWRRRYIDTGLKGGRDPSRVRWSREHFPDIVELENRYNTVGGRTME